VAVAVLVVLTLELVVQLLAETALLYYLYLLPVMQEMPT
jgi:hypothetical protein